eukprot:TRINITY_DN2052_c0_g1_i3.p1 TRINITY_DN2052_c0_g1~~TRINITY_DN2052_c0_g1_i3.p1  ORF type:complete len:1854 (+),score=515.98 TRINITY_DN2052_c0_g1_i3:362-5563(+)
MGKEEFSIEISGVHLGCKLQSGIDSSILFERFERKMKEEGTKGNLVSQSILIGSVFSQDVGDILAETFLESSMYMDASSAAVRESSGEVGRSGIDETQEGFRMVQNIMERILENIRIQIKDVSIDIDFDDLFGDSGLPSIMRFHLDEFELMSMKAYSAREHVSEEWNLVLNRQESDGEHTIARVLTIRGLTIALISPSAVGFDEISEEEQCRKDFVLFKVPSSDPWRMLVNVNQNTRSMEFHGEINAIMGQMFLIASPIRIRMLLLMLREVRDVLKRSNWYVLLSDKSGEKDAKGAKGDAMNEYGVTSILEQAAHAITNPLSQSMMKSSAIREEIKTWDHMDESDMSLSLYSMTSSENDEGIDEYQECHSDMKDVWLDQREQPIQVKSGNRTSKLESSEEDKSSSDGDGSPHAALENLPLWKFEFKEVDCKIVFLERDEVEFPVDDMERIDAVCSNGGLSLIGKMEGVHGGFSLLKDSQKEVSMRIRSFSLQMEDGSDKRRESILTIQDDRLLEKDSVILDISQRGRNVQLPPLLLNVVIEDVMNMWDVIKRVIPSPHAIARIEDDITRDRDGGDSGDEHADAKVDPLNGFSISVPSVDVEIFAHRDYGESGLKVDMKDVHFDISNGVKSNQTNIDSQIKSASVLLLSRSSAHGRNWKEVVFIGHDPLKSSAIAPIRTNIAFRGQVENNSEELLSYLHYGPGSSPTEWLWSEEDAMDSILTLRAQSVFDIGVEAQALRIRVRQVDVERLKHILNEISAEFLTRPHNDEEEEEKEKEDGKESPLGEQTVPLNVRCTKKSNSKRVASTMKADFRYMDVILEEEIVDDRCVKGVLLQMNTVQAMTIATTCVPCTRFHLSVRKMQMVERDDMGDQDVLRHSKRLGESEETRSLPCIQGQGLIFGVPCEFQCPALVTNMMLSSLYFDHRLYLKGKSWIDRIVAILVPKSAKQTRPPQKNEESEKDVSPSTITSLESESPPMSRTMVQVDLDIRDCVIYHRPSSKDIQSSGMICPQFVHLSTRLFTNSKEFHVHVRLSDAPFFLHPASKGDVLFMRKSRRGIPVTENPQFRVYLKSAGFIPVFTIEGIRVDISYSLHQPSHDNIPIAIKCSEGRISGEMCFDSYRTVVALIMHYLRYEDLTDEPILIAAGGQELMEQELMKAITSPDEALHPQPVQSKSGVEIVDEEELKASRMFYTQNIRESYMRDVSRRKQRAPLVRSMMVGARKMPIPIDQWYLEEEKAQEKYVRVAEKPGTRWIADDYDVMHDYIPRTHDVDTETARRFRSLPPTHPVPIIWVDMHHVDVNIQLQGGQDFDPSVGKDLDKIVEIDLQNVESQIYIFDDPFYVVRLTIAAENMEVIDHLKSSTRNKCISYWKTHGMPRESNSRMLTLLWEIVRVEGSDNPLFQEARVALDLLPIRINVDQDTMDFIIQFFSQDVSDDIEFEIDESEGGALVTSSYVSPPPSSGPYFQSFETTRDIRVMIDYKPKRVNLVTLRDGGYVELLNFFPLDGLELSFRRHCVQQATGFWNVIQGFAGVWVPDIFRSQLQKCMEGIPPFRSLFNIGTGFADLVVMPLKQYRKDRRLLWGMQKGASSFVKHMTVGTMNLAADVFSGTQILLEKTQELFRVKKDDRQILSKRAGQPAGVGEGFQQAIGSMKKTVDTIVNTIVAIPVHPEGHCIHGYVENTIRAVPVAVFAPGIGISEAMSKMAWGFRNAVDPIQKEDVDDIYKTEGKGKEEDEP